MAASAVVGLIANLAPWRRGMNDAEKAVKANLNRTTLRGFNQGIDDARKKVRGASLDLKRLAGLGRSFFAGFGAAAAAIGIFRSIRAINGAIWEGLKRVRAYQDSLVKVRAALASLPDDMKAGFSERGLQELGANIQTALGLAPDQVNSAFADMLTRGFDTSQARQLALLAANYAVKTGKPLTEVSKKIADAANGSVDAMKELGLEAAATGDRVRDGEAAVSALKNSYGSIATDLVNPSDQLKGNLEELSRILGEKIQPVLDPLIQGVGDFVAGLMGTEEGARILDGLALGLGTVIEFFKESAIRAEGAGKTIIGTFRLIGHSIESLVAKGVEMMARLYKAIPGGELIASKLGVDLDKSIGVAKEWQETAKAGVDAAVEQMNAGAGIMTTGEGSELAAITNRMTTAGRERREQARAALDKEAEATAGDTFAGKPAQDFEAEKRRKADAAAQKKLDARMGKNPDATARASYGSGTRLVLANRRGNPLAGIPARA